MRAAPGNVARFFGRRHTLPVGSGTVGLIVALSAVPVRGRRVLIPALACPNVAVAVWAAGGVPVLVEMSEATYDVSVEALASALGQDAAAVVAIDAFGYPSALEAVTALARRAGCVVVEDACQAYGGYDGGVPLGARGDVSVVSFGYAKPLELRGGGLVMTDDDALAGRIRAAVSSRRFRVLPSLKNRLALGLMVKERYRRMVEWQRRAGLLEYDFPPRLLARLESRFDVWTEQLDTMRRDLERARECLHRLPGVVPFEYRAGEWLPWRYSVRVPDGRERDSLVRRLARHGIRTTRLYRPVTEVIEAEVAGSIAGARELSEVTVNLTYRTEPAQTRALAERLDVVVGQGDDRG